MKKSGDSRLYQNAP